MKRALALVTFGLMVAACGDNIPAANDGGGAGGASVAKEAVHIADSLFSPGDVFFSFAESCTGAACTNYVPGGPNNHYWPIDVGLTLTYDTPSGPGTFVTYGAHQDTQKFPACMNSNGMQVTQINTQGSFASEFPDWFGTRLGFPRLADRASGGQWLAYELHPKFIGTTNCVWWNGTASVPILKIVILSRAYNDPDTYVKISSYDGHGTLFFAYMSFRGIGAP